jgi:3-methyladenine DNA glycosylase AlkD
MKFDTDKILEELKSKGSKKNREGMSRFGINVNKAFGVSVPNMRQLAKEIGKNHELALELWETGYHEARIVASMIADPKQVTEKLMDNWVKDFNSWDLCDQCCSNLFDKTPFAYRKISEWSNSREEFVKRAGFALMAASAVHHKKADDKTFIKFLPIIKRESTDERNYVRKAVNWALRQIGKRNLKLNKETVKTAKEIQKIDSKAARWIAADAIRELTSDYVQKRLRRY